MEFTQPLYFSRVRDPKDGSNPLRYEVSVVAGTIGLDGTPVRAVNIIDVQPTDVSLGFPDGSEGRFIDLLLDRPMTPYPAEYQLDVNGLWMNDLITELDPCSAALRFSALFKLIEPASIDEPVRGRDFANPQSSLAEYDPAVAELGAIPIGDDGDYQFDEGIKSFKKRIYRRIISQKQRFAHLVGYGVGVTSFSKLLGSASNRAALEDEARKQLLQEPETAKLSVRLVQDTNNPMLWRFVIKIKTRTGGKLAIAVPLPLV